MLALRIALTVAGAAILLVFTALSVGAIRVHQATARLVARLIGPPAPVGGTWPGTAARPPLPPPVVRYFRASLAAGTRGARGIRLFQRGRILVGRRMRSFTAVQHTTTSPTGFVWDAAVRLAPLVSVRVCDALVAGEASMTARLLATVSLVDERNDPGLTKGTLQRYLAEGVWFPPALGPDAGVVWEARDEFSALATIEHAGETASVEFRFDARGDVIEVYAAERPRRVDESYEPTPWIGRFSDHAVRHGLRIPLEAAVAWRLPDGDLEYWTGRIERCELIGRQDSAVPELASR